MTSPGSLPWPSSVEPLVMPVTCGGQEHRLVWADGSVTTADHPDLDAELALIAFGGAEPACVARYRLWHDAVADGGFLGEWVDETRLSPAWFSWLTMALERMRSEGFHEFLRRLPPARAQRMGEFLHHFPKPWIDRAAATVDHQQHGSAATGGVAEEAGEPDIGGDRELIVGLLAEASSHRLRRAFVGAVGGRQLAVGAAALVPLRIVVGGEAAVSGRLTGPDRGVRLTVPHGWLHRVWACGLSVIDGELTLAIEPAAGDRGAESAQAVVVAWAVDDSGLRPGLDRRELRLTSKPPPPASPSPTKTMSGQED